MTRLVLDSGGLSHLASKSPRAVALIRMLIRVELWPPIVPTVVLVESLPRRPGRDADVNRFLRTCIIDDSVPEGLARQAADLRGRARQGSTVDALVVALAEPDGTVLTGDRGDLEALAAHTAAVQIHVV